MSLFDLLFGTPEPDPKTLLSAKMGKAAGALMEVVQEAKTNGFNVKMTVTNGVLSLTMSEEIFKTEIGKATPQNPKK